MPCRKQSDNYIWGGVTEYDEEGAGTLTSVFEAPWCGVFSYRASGWKPPGIISRLTSGAVNEIY